MVVDVVALRGRALEVGGQMPVGVVAKAIISRLRVGLAVARVEQVVIAVVSVAVVLGGACALQQAIDDVVGVARALDGRGVAVGVIRVGAAVEAA